ncbi:hypothetical protein N6P31_09385 [Pectobacterium betavasculorum]|uniref:hypothetical protein n=1 Tax=Pectobacterium betavasculorum TaxID=55207 RepID=UPI00313EEDCC
MERIEPLCAGVNPTRKSYQLIMNGIEDCATIQEQRCLIVSMIYQCALLARVTAGETAFQALMGRLGSMSFDELEAATALAKPGEGEVDNAHSPS